MAESKHKEMVEHLRRHTELRRKAAEEQARRATMPEDQEGEVGDDQTGG